MSARKVGSLCLVACLAAHAASAQMTVTVTDISPNQSTFDATNPNGASGGRVNGLAVDRTTAGRFYAASEWGGVFRSNDNGLTWAHLDGHVPTATWDVEVDPTNSNRVYATSFYDGRVVSRSGINVSTDGGTTWTHPATATPPANLCQLEFVGGSLVDVRRAEPAAFGISIDPANANRVFIGTNCGLAFSTDAGATWTFVDPTPATRATTVWDVVVHDGGIIDLCGDDGHRRSIDGGMTWTTAANPLQSLTTGRCSIAVSPDEAYVLYAVVGQTIFESDNAGQAWTSAAYPNPNGQGRIPFVATNQRQGAGYDLWFGDVQLHRRTCTTPNPPAQGGALRCNAGGAWTAGPFTRTAGAHDDSGDIAFVPNVAVDACPILFSSDGGVYRNTTNASPGCHSPAWEQPNVTPHALWNYAFSGVQRAGAQPEDLYFGNQDTGTFGSTNAAAAAVTWSNQRCCDGFAALGEGTRGVTTVCCCNGAGCNRQTRMFLSNPGLPNAPAEVEISAASYPPGNFRTFEHLRSIENFGPDDYVVATVTGVFVTFNIGAATIAWTQLGAGNTPANRCGVQVAFAGGTPTFFVKSGGCDGDATGTLWRHQGTAAGGTWQQVPNPGTSGSFGIYAVDRNNPQRIIASHLGGPSGPRMVMTWNGGTTWSPLPALDLLMTGSGTFQYQTGTGPSVFTGFNGYPQPTLVAFDPADPDLIVAGGADAGVFLSANGGTRWQLVTDPVSPGTSGTPHVPRPYYAHFDHDPSGGDINLFLGTRGRGAWRLTFKKVAMPEIQVAAPPFFEATCVATNAVSTLNVCNSSTGNLMVSGITSSDAQFTVIAPSSGFPVTISHDFCFPFQVAFAPTSPGPKTATFTVASNDPNFPSVQVTSSVNVGAPRAVTVIADTGSFGEVCASPAKFRDADITLSNSGSCPLIVTGVASSSPEFEPAQVLNFPLIVDAGDTVAVPIRFRPTSPGAKSGTITFATNDPATPNKVVNVSGTAPPSYVCQPPTFAALDAAIGFTFGSSRTGNYTYNGGARFLKPFGTANTFAVQAQGEAMYFPGGSGRQEGQLDAGLLYRRAIWQFGVSGSFRTAALRFEASPGALTHGTLTLDALLPNVRVGIFGSRGIKENDVVTLSETVGAPAPGGQPVIANEQVLHTVDQIGGTLQAELAPDWWLDGHLAWLHRHTPGVGNTAGGAVGVSWQVLPNIALTGRLDVNESFISSSTMGTITFGVTIGRWSRPEDYSNPVNPLGTVFPRVRYELFNRVR
jgi:hypothetical protein